MFVFPVVSPFRLRVSQHLDHAAFPVRATSNAACGFPALLFASPQGLWDLSCRGDFRPCPPNPIAVVERVRQSRMDRRIQHARHALVHWGFPLKIPDHSFVGPLNLQHDESMRARELELLDGTHEVHRVFLIEHCERVMREHRAGETNKCPSRQ
jgi:hypothetical protein